MKQLVVCLSLLTVGCLGQSYSSTRVGPDRFTVVSSGHDQGPENYGHILEQAYTTCNQAGFKDYVVMQTVFDTRRVIVFVRCAVERQEVAQSPTSEKVANDKSNAPSGSLSEDLDKLYRSAKKKLQEATKE